MFRCLILDLQEHPATLRKRPMMIMRPLLNLSRTRAVHTDVPSPKPGDPVVTRRRVVAKRPPTVAEEEEIRQKRLGSESVPESFPLT